MRQLVLFTSAPPDRPQYIRDFLSCLAAPDGHRLTYSYERKWIDDSVIARAGELEGSRALIVFCEPYGDDFRFHPLRWCRIVNFEPREIIERGLATDATHLAIRFKLDRPVHASPNGTAALLAAVTEEVRAWDRRPLRRDDPSPDSTWVMFGRVPETTAEVTPQTSWISHAQALNEYESLNGCTLFRVSRPIAHRSLAPDREVGIRDDSFLSESYRLVGQRQYRVGVSFFLREGVDPTDLVDASVSSPVVRLTPPITRSIGREAQVTIFFSSARVTAREIATVTVQGCVPTTRTLDPTNRYWPAVSFVVRFRPHYGSVVLGLLLIAIGVLLSGFSAADWDPILADLTSQSVLAIKGLGVLLAVAGSFIAFRRTPGAD